MKFLVTSLAIVLCVVCSAEGFTRTARGTDEPTEQKIAVDAAVTVTLCVMSGEINVHGWERNEVVARSADAEQIELRRVGETDQSKPAKKIDVFIDDGTGKKQADCQASADVELNVPKGATVQIQTRDGDICIVGVDAAYAGSQNGDICFEHVAQRIEAGSIGGSISVKDSSGRVSLSTAGGGIDATNVKALTDDDVFEVVSVSGDIQLDQVTHAKLVARSVTGNIVMTGPLARRGDYGFTTTSGDVTLVLPSNPSFRLVAKLSQDGEIVTDFPLTIQTEPTAPPAKPAKGAAAPAPPPAPSPAMIPAPGESEGPKAMPGPEPTPAPKVQVEKKSGVTIVKMNPPLVKVPVVVGVGYPIRRLIGICGAGDATLTVNSFSGNLNIKKN
jgi:DUF4097 and DUF4098 domain-containing protein YvlB